MIIAIMLLNRGEQAPCSEKKVSSLFHFTQDLKHFNYVNGTLQDWVPGISILHPQFPDETFSA